MRLPTLLLATLLLLPVSLARASDGPDLTAVGRLLRRGTPSERAAALRRLAGCEETRALALLLDALDDPHPYVRRASAGVLGALGGAAQGQVARRMRRLGAPGARVAAARAAALWTSDVGRALLGDLLADPEPPVRAAAVGWLAEAADDEALLLIRGRLDDPDGLVRALVLDALVACEDVEGLDWLRFTADADARVRLSALEGSVACGIRSRPARSAVVVVLHGLTDTVWSNRLRAAELSSSVPDRRLLSALVDRLEDPRQRIRAAALAALVDLTRIPFDPDPAVWRAWLAGDGHDFDPAHAGDQPSSDARAPPPGRRTVAAPRFLELPLASRHVAFVLDASGSMARRDPAGRRRWDVIVAELDRALERMGSAEVDVICFADEARALFGRARKLTARRRAEIRRHLAAQRPAGATALFDGIAAGLTDPSIDTVVVLSDGAPSAGRFFTKTEVLVETARLNRFRRARIDVIQVGAEGIARRWRDVLARLSRESGGTFVRR